MKLGVFKKVCLTVMGVGVVGSLVSVGTFATFTATTVNPGNSFSAGTLLITNANVSGSTFTTSGSVGAGLQGPNITTSGASVSAGDTPVCTNVVASSCSTLIATSRVTSVGMEPGQYAQGTITVKNAGTLPAAYMVQVQNVTVTNSAGSCPPTSAPLRPAPSA